MPHIRCTSWLVCFAPGQITREEGRVFWWVALSWAAKQSCWLRVGTPESAARSFSPAARCNPRCVCAVASTDPGLLLRENETEIIHPHRKRPTFSHLAARRAKNNLLNGVLCFSTAHLMETEDFASSTRPEYALPANIVDCGWFTYQKFSITCTASSQNYTFAAG